MTPKRMACWFLAALFLTGTALAEEAFKPESRVKPKAPTFRLHAQKLMPRVFVELESLSAYHRVVEPGHQLQDHVLFDQLAANVRRDVERMTRKAVKNYLMEVINLDRGIDSLKSRVRGEPTGRRSMHFRLGFHSQLPVVGVKFDAGPGELGLKVGADGAVGLHYNAGPYNQADFSANFDGEDRFEIRARLAF